MTVAPGDRFRAVKRIEDRLFGGIGGGLKQRIETRVVDERRHRDEVCIVRHGVRGREGERDVAAAVSEDRSGACETGGGAHRETAQLTASSGASVAINMMIDPCSGFSSMLD